MQEAFLINLCENMERIERQAAGLLLEARSVSAQCKSGQRDLVTEYDQRVQEQLMAQLRACLPEARFFCEENDQQDDLGAEHLFIIDPIDGTMNFVRHMNHSCLSVAYASRGRVLAAAVYNPYVDEMFTAVRGQGARLNGQMIHVEDKPLAETLVCFGTSPYHPQLADESFRLLRKVFDLSLDVRRQGSAELDLCSAAAGRAGVYFESCVSLWDYAAGMLLVEEAGGICRTLQGKELPLDASKPGIVAGGAAAVAEVLALAEA